MSMEFQGLLLLQKPEWLHFSHPPRTVGSFAMTDASAGTTLLWTSDQGNLLRDLGLAFVNLSGSSSL